MSQDNEPRIKIWTREELDEIIRPMTEAEREEFLNSIPFTKLALDGTKICPITGRTRINWRVSGRRPQKLIKEKFYKFTKQQLIEAGADLAKLGIS